MLKLLYDQQETDTTATSLTNLRHEAAGDNISAPCISTGNKIWRDKYSPEVKKWLLEQDVSFYHQDLENLTVCSNYCLITSVIMWKNTGLEFNHRHVLYSSPLTSIYLVKKKT